VQGVVQEISVNLCKLKARIEHKAAGNVAFAAGNEFMLARDRPSLQVDSSRMSGLWKPDVCDAVKQADKAAQRLQKINVTAIIRNSKERSCEV
jgi:hypothetical protein